MASNLDAASIGWVINHVFLPPKLLEERENQSFTDLANFLLRCLDDFMNFDQGNDRPALDFARKSIKNFMECHDGLGNTDKKKLSYRLNLLHGEGNESKICSVPTLLKCLQADNC